MAAGVDVARAHGRTPSARGADDTAARLGGTTESRVRLAASDESSADLLAALADDDALTVRVAVAMNNKAPVAANRRLARDGDERVRSLLARKVAAVIPHLPAEERGSLQAHAFEVLRELVDDEAVRVREAIADVVKDMDCAPRDLIVRLARDTAVSVSEPVISLSPLLSDPDLLAILAAPSHANAGIAVARRQGLSEAVSDAIACQGDAAAITALLENHSAAIREATLDSLIARAPAHVAWHEPLARRPALTGQAVRALSRIVATHVLRTITARLDLSPEAIAELRQRLTERMSHPHAAPGAASDSATEADAALAEARSLLKADLLNERRLLEAAMQGDAHRAAAMLAVSAGVDLAVVQRAARMRNAKGLVSLVWTAGFTMRLAIALQALLAGLAPDALLRATFGGGFPLGPEEMRWQIACLTRGAR